MDAVAPITAYKSGQARAPNCTNHTTAHKPSTSMMEGIRDNTEKFLREKCKLFITQS